MNRKNNTAGMIGMTLAFLTAAFVVLKANNAIEMSWLWVLSPIWIPAALALAIIFIVLVVILVKQTSMYVQHDINAKARAAYYDDMAAEYGLHRHPGESNADLMRRVRIIKQAERREKHGD